MNRCPITYALDGENHYSDGGLRLLSPELNTIKDLEYMLKNNAKRLTTVHQKCQFREWQPEIKCKIKHQGR